LSLDGMVHGMVPFRLLMELETATAHSSHFLVTARSFAAAP